MNDRKMIYLDDALDAINDLPNSPNGYSGSYDKASIISALEEVPSAQPERLTDDDFETIRIHLNACKEQLCNQHRWKEAEEYQRIIDRFMAFASAQQERTCEYWDNESKFCALCRPSAEPQRKKGRWIRITQGAMPEQYICPFCHRTVESYGVEELLSIRYPYCHCGADMRGEQDG